MRSETIRICVEIFFFGSFSIFANKFIDVTMNEIYFNLLVSPERETDRPFLSDGLVSGGRESLLFIGCQHDKTFVVLLCSTARLCV